MVAIDPPASAGEKADECGIVAAGISEDKAAYVLADASVQGLSPAGWARKAIALYHSLKADRNGIEPNQGGANAEHVHRQGRPTGQLASGAGRRGKRSMAEPVAER